MSRLRLCDDVSPAAWIAARLAGGVGRVGATVPRGYEAYARICHPATDRQGTPASWSQVAAVTGGHAHALMQWHALVGSADPDGTAGSLWPGAAPERGNLEPELLEQLCALLLDHTPAGDCFFCVWEGYGWIGREPARGLARGSAADTLSVPGATDLGPEAIARALVELPARRYLLLAGDLAACASIGPPYFRQSPNLFWPADQSWCVATELDFDSTLVGGRRELIEAILGVPALDAWVVEPDDALTFDADTFNTA